MTLWEKNRYREVRQKGENECGGWNKEEPGSLGGGGGGGGGEGAVQIVFFFRGKGSEGCCGWNGSCWCRNAGYLGIWARGAFLYTSTP